MLPSSAGRIALLIPPMGLCGPWLFTAFPGSFLKTKPELLVGALESEVLVRQGSTRGPEEQ